MAIKLDISSESVVVYCTDCGHWRAFAWTPEAGNDRAAAHEELVHPEQRAARHRIEARNRKAQNAARHAADSIEATIRPDDSSHGNSRTARPRTRDERPAQLVVPAGHHIAV